MGETIGEAVLESAGLRYPFFWVWIDIGALLGFWFVLNLATYFCLLILGGDNSIPLGLLSPPPPPPTLIPFLLFSSWI